MFFGRNVGLGLDQEGIRSCRNFTEGTTTLGKVLAPFEALKVTICRRNGKNTVRWLHFRPEDGTEKSPSPFGVMEVFETLDDFRARVNSIGSSMQWKSDRPIIHTKVPQVAAMFIPIPCMFWTTSRLILTCKLVLSRSWKQLLFQAPFSLPVAHITYKT
jgi:hypothetical protein